MVGDAAGGGGCIGVDLSKVHRELLDALGVRSLLSLGSRRKEKERDIGEAMGRWGGGER